jgi:DNA-binding NarL/FixJ family response regulator
MKVALWAEDLIIFLGFTTWLQQSKFEVGAQSSTDKPPAVNSEDILVLYVSGTLADNMRQVRQACSLGPKVILLLKEPASTDIVPTLIDAGVVGLLLANAKDSAINYCIEEVDSGRTLFTQSAIPGFDFRRPFMPKEDDPLAVLSPRELEVYRHLITGMKAKDIAALLEISPKTVDTYRASLMRKLNVRDIVALVKFSISIQGGTTIGPNTPTIN